MKKTKMVQNLPAKLTTVDILKNFKYSILVVR